MNNLEKQLIGAARNADAQGESSIGAQLMSKLSKGQGDSQLRTEGIKQELGLSSPAPVATEEITEKIIKKATLPNKNGRNHRGNGAKANPLVLAEAIKSADATNEAGDRAKIVSVFNKEKLAIEKEVAETSARIQEAQKAGQTDVAKNWAIRHKKAADILEMFASVADVIDSESGKTVWGNLQRYSKARHEQAQSDLKERGLEKMEEDFNLDFTTQTPGEGVALLDRTIPTLTDVVESEVSADIKQESPAESVDAIEPLEEAATVENISSVEKETPEEKKERMLKAIYNPEKQSAIEARAEKAAVPKELLRGIGERWNKVPLGYKFAISGALILTGAGLGASAAIPVATVGGIMRALGMAGLYTATDEKLRTAVENKTGDPRTTAEKSRHQKLAISLAVVVGLCLPRVLHDSVLNPLVDFAHSPHDSISSGSSLPPLETPAHTTAPITENLVSAGSFIEIAKPGDSIWKMAEAQLSAHGSLAGLSPEQQTYLIDSVKDQITEHPDQFGITDINTIQVGQGVDFEIILNDKEFMDNAIASAKGLAPEEVASIANYENAPVYETEGYIENGQAEPLTTPESNILENNTIKVDGTTGTFIKAADGTITGFVTNGELVYPQTIEAQKILNDGWRGVVLSNATGESSLNTSVVENRAFAIYQHEQILHALDQHGGQFSKEADFIRDQISSMVADTENTFGDVFKDPTEVYPSGLVETTEATPATNTAPQEVSSTDPEIIKVADQQFHTRVTDVLGSKGLLGFGAVDGTTTSDWKNPEFGFANKTVEEIMNAKPIVLPGDAPTIGINNPSKLHEMQDYFRKVFIETGTNLDKGDTAETYLKRASMLSALHK
ncbi:MAG: hypothetical protein WC791_01770 [Candidatus Paceibacterota bacterium]|jgi:hypothetical protein